MPDETTPAEPTVSEYEQERRKKRDALVEAGLDVYGRRTTGIEPIVSYDGKQGEGDEGPVAKVAGRIVLKRDMGKLSFLTIRDDTGDLQIGLAKNRLSDDGWTIRNALDLGDLIVCEGKLGLTKTGQATVWADSVSMASKSLVTPPDKHKGLEDQEIRYRQRYVDLWANPESMDVMKKRFQIIDRMRQYLRDKGFLEVETPMLQSIHGGAAARPFETHHNAYDIPLFLRIAPELYLKRLLVGGMPKVFEINRNFRNEGVSPWHNPEFTMLEAYEAYGNFESMADLVEDMICTVMQQITGTLKIPYDTGNIYGIIDIDLGKRPWRRVAMSEIVEEITGMAWTKDGFSTDDAIQLTEESTRFLYNQKYVPKDGEYPPKYHDDVVANAARFAKLSPAEQLAEAYEKNASPFFFDPTFVTHIPSVIVPLARPSVEDPYFCDSYELAIAGREISPGYTELNDPDVQARLFRDQAVEDEGERQKVDHDFLHALKVGMPPAGGMGLGVDRLVMLLLGQPSIRDVLAFPLMKPVGEGAKELRS